MEEDYEDNELLLAIPVLLTTGLREEVWSKSDLPTHSNRQTNTMAVPTPKIKKAKASAAPDPMADYLRLFPGISQTAVERVLAHDFRPSRVGKIYNSATQFEASTPWFVYVNKVSRMLARQDEALTFGRRALIVPKEWPMKRSEVLIRTATFRFTTGQLNKWWVMEELSHRVRGYICLFSLLIAEEDLAFAFRDKDHLFASLLKVFQVNPDDNPVIEYLTNDEHWTDEDDVAAMTDQVIGYYSRWSLPMVIGYDLNEDSGLIYPALPEFTDPRLLEGVDEDLMVWITHVLEEYHRLRVILSDPEYLRNLPRAILEEYGMIRLPTSRVASVTSLIHAFHGLQGYVEGAKFIHEMNKEGAGPSEYVVHPIYQKLCVAVRRMVEEYKRMHFFEEVDGTTLLQKAAIIHSASVNTLSQVSIQSHLTDERFNIDVHLESTSSCAGERPAEVIEEPLFEYESDEDGENGVWHAANGADAHPPAFNWPEW